MLVHRRVTPSSKFASTHFYTWVEGGTIRVKYLAQEHNAVLQPGLKPRPPDPESSPLTIRPPHLPFICWTPLYMYITANIFNPAVLLSDKCFITLVLILFTSIAQHCQTLLSCFCLEQIIMLPRGAGASATANIHAALLHCKLKRFFNNLIRREEIFDSLI